MKALPQDVQMSEFKAAACIKEIGRGKDGARDLSREAAYQLYAAMLDGRVSDLEMGGILLAMRIKGESIGEIAGFLDAAEDHMQALQIPDTGKYSPIVIPSYNGARKRANLTPLLALLLAREGVPVLVHGVTQDAGRVSSAEIFSALGIQFSESVAHAEQQLKKTNFSFMPIQVLAPDMYKILMMRQVLGVRSSTHTLVKILQPFAQAALRLACYTHPEYQIMLDRYFRELAPHSRGDVLLMRGTEGEAVASTGRAQQIDYYHFGARETLQTTASQLMAEPENLPESLLPESTAHWIKAVLADDIRVPENIARQVEFCLRCSKKN